jgi:hypothetical protein
MAVHQRSFEAASVHWLTLLSMQDLLRNVSWTISNFFRWKNPPAPLEKMHRALEMLQTSMSEDPEVLSNLSWAGQPLD